MAPYLPFQGDASAVPCFEDIRKSYKKSDYLLLDRNLHVIHELRVDPMGRRLEWTCVDDISPLIEAAVLKAEDRRFYHHAGVDYQAIMGSIARAFVSGRLRGASTITMQLASLLDPKLAPSKGKRDLSQKWRQIKTAFQIEEKWSKKEILEAYLNIVAYRGELQGIAAASRSLFGKQPHGLVEAESLILASLIRAPNAPLHEVKRRCLSLCRELRWSMKGEELDSLLGKIYSGQDKIEPIREIAPHAARQLLRLGRDGEAVVSTLDSGAQNFVVERLRHHLSVLQGRNVREGAVLAGDNESGDIIVYVSLSDDSPYVDGIKARRQAGSVLKPFLYALAFDEKILTPASLIEDSQMDLLAPGGIYAPKNYDNSFRGKVSARDALASSLNVPAVRVLSLVGEDLFLAGLRKLGLTGLSESGDFYGPSLALGTADVSLFELVKAYMALANGGVLKDMDLVRKSKNLADPIKAFSPEAAFLVSDILSDRGARSLTFGLENPLSTRFRSAVKTGTSKDMRDNWCVGYSSRFTVGVWVGNYSGQPMWDVSGITGAAQVWAEVMNLLHRGFHSPAPEPPSGLVRMMVGDPSEGKEEWFIKGTEPLIRMESAGKAFQRIEYPVNRSIIALDPDIPSDKQRIFFAARIADKEDRWVLNGTEIHRANESSGWKPIRGKHLLRIVNKEGVVLDQIFFEVRGSCLPDNRFAAPSL
ncbi:MAG: penicillin-binding protein 1C [Desulfobacteraceae bacterium]|nr:MAG: penicillin-binding protein 1C [Desulfobacteraceae bacterium]